MRIRLPIGLFIAGTVTIATLVFAGERIAFEAQALLLRPTDHVYDASSWGPEVTIYCDKPGCEPGMIYYEVIVDAAGRPRALLTELEFRFDPSARSRAARAALAARWPAPESGRPFRGYQVVLNAPPERLPTRHVPFPDTEGQAVSITLERAGMYDPYGIYSVTLDSDGDIDFCGPGFVKAPGQQRSRISRLAFDALVQEFRKADFFSLDDHYVSNTAESEDIHLRVRIGDQEKMVMDSGGFEVGMPAVIRSLQKAVDEAAETSRWVGSPQEWTSGGYDAAQCTTDLSEAGRRAFVASRRAAGY
jgi:hypothetical protein